MGVDLYEGLDLNLDKKQHTQYAEVKVVKMPTNGTLTSLPKVPKVLAC